MATTNLPQQSALLRQSTRTYSSLWGITDFYATFTRESSIEKKILPGYGSSTSIVKVLRLLI